MAEDNGYTYQPVPNPQFPGAYAVYPGGFPQQPIYYQPVPTDQPQSGYVPPQQIPVIQQQIQVSPNPVIQPVPSAQQATAPQQEEFDFSFVHTPARIAVYDDFLSEPRIITIDPAPTMNFIGALAAEVYKQSQNAGGNIAYSIILQVTENFIHARFSEMVVSIFNNGKTIRFSDQGPGFKNKEQALQPGFSSATQPMKLYIKGVGSGLPTVKEWLQVANEGGKITIEDNLNGGAVVTLTVGEEPKETPPLLSKKPAAYLPPLNQKEKHYVSLFHTEGALGITELSELTGIAKSTVSNDLKKLQEMRVIEMESGSKRRLLTELGEQLASQQVNGEN